MKEKTIRQIENMKRQTIGVEVEMNNITRHRAAQVAASFFGTGRVKDTAHVNGYMTWSAWDAQGREWKFQRDSSIYGPDDEKCELVTPILLYEDIELLQKLLRQLRKAGAKSSPSRGCGVHIHVGKGEHTPKTIRNLVNIMAAHEAQIGKAIKVDPERVGTYCQMVHPEFLRRVNAYKPDNFSDLSHIWYAAHDALRGQNAHYNPSRYHMINLHALFTKGTIEFRLFQFDEPHDGKEGGLHAGQLKAYIQLCLAMSELAKEVSCASSKPQQTENEKYAFRCWMLRLGFIGAEFATARSILLKNMAGNGAWR